MKSTVDPTEYIATEWTLQDGRDFRCGSPRLQPRSVLLGIPQTHTKEPIGVSGSDNRHSYKTPRLMRGFSLTSVLLPFKSGYRYPSTGYRVAADFAAPRGTLSALRNRSSHRGTSTYHTDLIHSRKMARGMSSLILDAARISFFRPAYIITG